MPDAASHRMCKGKFLTIVEIDLCFFIFRRPLKAWWIPLSFEQTEANKVCSDRDLQHKNEAAAFRSWGMVKRKPMQLPDHPFHWRLVRRRVEFCQPVSTVCKHGTLMGVFRDKRSLYRLTDLNMLSHSLAKEPLIFWKPRSKIQDPQNPLANPRFPFFRK